MEISGTQPTRLLPLAVVEERTGYRKSKLYELLAKNAFPRPVRDGRSVRFVEREVDGWIAQRIAERDAALGVGNRVLLREQDIAEMFSLPRSFLQRDRLKAKPTVPFARVGPHIRYDPDAVRAALRVPA